VNRSSGAAAHRVGGADYAVVAGQLKRAPHDMSRVVARCPHGFPAAVENLPYDAGGRPFPTLFYLTCPTYAAAISELESAGGVRAWARRLRGAGDLARSLGAEASAARRRRRDLAHRYRLPMLDAGVSLTTGVGGVSDRHAVKCLHAHVAHALAHPAYAFGAAVAAEVARPWCGDRRCAPFVPHGGVRPAS